MNNLKEIPWCQVINLAHFYKPNHANKCFRFFSSHHALIYSSNFANIYLLSSYQKVHCWVVRLFEIGDCFLFLFLLQNETSHKHFCLSFPQVSLGIFRSVMILITKRVSCFFVLYASSPKMVSHNSRMGIEVFYSAKIQFLTLSPLRVTSIQFLLTKSPQNHT